jgi:hypothetical protein
VWLRQGAARLEDRVVFNSWLHRSVAKCFGWLEQSRLLFQTNALVLSERRSEWKLARSIERRASGTTNAVAWWLRVGDRVCSADGPFWPHSYCAAPPVVVVALGPPLGWIVAGSQTLAPHRCRRTARCVLQCRADRDCRVGVYTTQTGVRITEEMYKKLRGWRESAKERKMSQAGLRGCQGAGCKPDLDLDQALTCNACRWVVAQPQGRSGCSGWLDWGARSAAQRRSTAEVGCDALHANMGSGASKVGTPESNVRLVR